MGYNLVYSATSVFNFAQGDLVTLGGLITYSLIVSRRWGVALVVVPVLASVALAGIVQERITIAPLVRRGEQSFAWVITTLGASVVLENIYQLRWGSQSKPVPSLVGNRSISIFGSALSSSEVLIIVVAVVCAIGIEVWTRATLGGKTWKATSEDPQAALARGINVRRVGAISFFVAGGVSGLAGMVTVPVTSASFSSGSTLALSGFVAIALGGFGNQMGALVGGIMLGVVEAEALLFINATLQDAVGLAVLVLVLMVRPTGLLGYRGEREV